MMKSCALALTMMLYSVWPATSGDEARTRIVRDNRVIAPTSLFIGRAKATGVANATPPRAACADLRDARPSVQKAWSCRTKGPRFLDRYGTGRGQVDACVAETDDELVVVAHQSGDQKIDLSAPPLEFASSFALNDTLATPTGQPGEGVEDDLEIVRGPYVLILGREAKIVRDENIVSLTATYDVGVPVARPRTNANVFEPQPIASRLNRIREIVSVTLNKRDKILRTTLFNDSAPLDCTIEQFDRPNP